MFFYQINYIQPMHAKIMKKNIFAILLYYILTGVD